METGTRLRDVDQIVIVNTTSVAIITIVIIICNRTAGRALAAAMSFGRISDGRKESRENVLTVASTCERSDVEGEVQIMSWW